MAFINYSSSFCFTGPGTSSVTIISGCWNFENLTWWNSLVIANSECNILIFFFLQDNASMISTTSESKNKEILLIGTIQHWKHLEVSHIFYAWFKYTARKKFLRQTYAELVERKNAYLMHIMFLKWNRELFGKRASEEKLVCAFIMSNVQFYYLF